MKRLLKSMAPLGCAVLLLLVAATTARAADGVTLLASGDTQGHVEPCRNCPMTQGLGGLARRATWVNEVRAAGPLLLVDAGNALFGEESFASEGRVIVAAYNAMGYDAVNLSYRDFRLGKATTLAALEGAQVPFVSANLYHADESDRRLVEPYVVRERGGQRWAIVGLSERPAAIQAMPHLRQQLTGVTIRPPAEALADVLPEALDVADAVILLYYGSAASAHALLNELDEADADSLHVVVAAGESSASDTPPIGWTRKHGTHLAQWSLPVPADAAPSLEQVEVSASIEPDSDLAATLEPMTRFDSTDVDDTDAVERIRDRLPAEAAMQLDHQHKLRAVATNRALRLNVNAISLHEQYGDVPAPEGMRWLVLDGEIENQMPIDLVFELDYPEAMLIASLPRQLFLVVNNREVRRLARPELPGHMPTEAVLPEAGTRINGNLVFAVPAEGLESLSLRYYHDQYAPLVLPLLGDEPVEPAEPVQPPQANSVMELAIYAIDEYDRLGDRVAPEGMRFIRVDLRGHSLVQGDIDALALDRDADPQATAPLNRVMEYLYGDSLIELLVDGEYGYTMDAALSTMDPEPPILPDAVAGGAMVFLVPEDVQSLELVCSYPELRFPTIGSLGVPNALRFTIEGDPVAGDAHEPLAVVEDDPTPLEILRSQWVAREDGEGMFLVLTMSLRNESDEGGLFPLASRFQADVGGVVGRAVALTLPHGAPVREPMWLPAGQRRTFQVVFEARSEVSQARLSYGGVSVNRTVELNLHGSEPSDGSFAMPEPEATVAAPEPSAAAPASPSDSPMHASADELDDAPRMSAPVADADDQSEPFIESSVVAPALAEPTAGSQRTFGQVAEASQDDREVLEPDEPSAAAGLAGDAQLQVIPAEEVEQWVHERNRDGVNLALHMLGGEISTDSGMSGRNLPQLHNARIDRPVRLLPGRYHWQLAGASATTIDTVAIVNDSWLPDLKLTVQAANEHGGYETIATIQGVEESELHIWVLTFDPVETDKVRLIIEETESENRARRVRNHEIMIFEGPLADKSESVLSQGGTNISRLNHGGSLFHLHPEHGRQMGNLITRPDDGRARMNLRRNATGVWLPPITLAFQANREALIEAVEIWPSSREDEQDRLPVRVRLTASIDEPFEGHHTVGEYDITTDEVPWRVELPQPLRARFLNIELAGAVNERYMTIGEVVVREGTEAGYESVLIRGDGVNWRQREQPTLASLMGDDVDHVRQIQGGESAASAMDVPPGRWVGGTLDGPNQKHLYRFTVGHDASQIPELQMHMAPFLRGQVRILTAEGDTVDSLNPGRRESTTLHYPLMSLDPGEYLLEVTSAPIYLFLGFDSSGSMGRALRITPEILPTLTDNLPEGVYVALGSSHTQSEDAQGSFTVYSDYTRDGEALRKAITEREIADRKMFDSGGGSDWYNFMRDMMQWADQNMPSHAVGATVVVADGVGSGDYYALWDRLRASNQRLYAVGWGSATLRLDHVDSGIGWTAARGLFNTAWYRNGRYFEPQADEELIDTYHAILDDVLTPAEYAWRIHVRDRLPGQLVTTKPEGEERPILFVLDLSGSMMEMMGDQTRLDVAFDVMEEVVAGLPTSSQVGLRVYGHRFRAFGAEREQAATDTELLIPIGPLDRASFMQTVRGLNARGATPLAHTLEQVPGDLHGVDLPRVIVLTDGVESFRRDPAAKTRQMREQFPDMELAVVGFKIGQQVDRENLRGMAEAGEGVYYNAMDAESLVQSLEEAINPVVRYTIREVGGPEAAAGQFGNQHELREGLYELTASVEGGQARLPIQIHAQRTVRLSLEDLPDAEPVTAEQTEASPPRDTAQPEQASQFCTQCGEQLPGDARFCTHCGHAVQ